MKGIDIKHHNPFDPAAVGADLAAHQKHAEKQKNIANEISRLCCDMDNLKEAMKKKREQMEFLQTSLVNIALGGVQTEIGFAKEDDDQEEEG